MSMPKNNSSPENKVNAWQIHTPFIEKNISVRKTNTPTNINSLLLAPIQHMPLYNASVSTPHAILTLAGSEGKSNGRARHCFDHWIVWE